jgi:hypothetical protein
MTGLTSFLQNRQNAIFEERLIGHLRILENSWPNRQAKNPGDGDAAQQGSSHHTQFLKTKAFHRYHQSTGQLLKA